MQGRLITRLLWASALLVCGCSTEAGTGQSGAAGASGAAGLGVGGTLAPTGPSLVAGTPGQGGASPANLGGAGANVGGIAGAAPAAGANSAGVGGMAGGAPLAGTDAAGVGGMAGGADSPESGGSGAGDAAPNPSGCGTRSGMRGKTSRSVMVSGSMRTFIAYLPPTASPTTALPFVYVFHGATQTGQYLYDMTEYAKLADAEGIAVVFPDGQGTSSATSTGNLAPWNVSDGPLVCGLGTLVSNPNPVDFTFVDAMRADIEQDQCIDADHVFATGFSMGGYFTHHIACDRPDFRAAAPHSGGTMADLSSCKTDHVPILIFHGTADPLIADNCDDPAAPADPGYPASATLWAMKNGCAPTYTTIAANGSGGSNAQCYLYDGCPADGQVEMCAFQGMAHCWAGAPTCPGCIGTGPTYASATQLEWEFFKQYAW